MLDDAETWKSGLYRALRELAASKTALAAAGFKFRARVPDEILPIQ